MNKIVKRTIGIILTLILSSVIIIGGLMVFHGSRPITEGTDYLVVLGARVYGEVPSPSLTERLKVSKEYLIQNQDIKVILSGGQGPGESITEALAMKRYLLDNGIDEDRIILEDRSTSTFENLQFSLDKIREIDDSEDISILIATNSYHIFRAKLLAGRLGVKAYGLPAKIPPTTLVKSYVREYLAVIKSWIFDRVEDESEGLVEKEELVFDDTESSLTEESLLNPSAMTIEGRYVPPKGFERTKASDDSFGKFLRSQKLKPYGDKVLYYDGREKNRSGVYDSVFDVNIGDRDLHQCADAIMLLRGEYLYSQGRYDEISFNFVSGFEAEYVKWMEGYRIKVDGNSVSYYKATEANNTYEVFRKYMDMVFAYSGTLSLSNELNSVDVGNMEIGHVFIVGGSPGHAVIVVDMAENQEGDRMFMLAQSYMPAQETQILVNPKNNDISPWYSLKDMDRLVTPEWSFDIDALKGFN